MRINKQSKAQKTAEESPRKRERRNGVEHRKIWVCNLRFLRDKHNLTMDQVAAGVSLSKTAYWQIEHGSDPMLTSAKRIADFFGQRLEAIWPETQLKRAEAVQ